MGVSDGPNVVNDGLILYLDGKNPRSYPGSGNTWYDLSSNANHFTLANNPVWHSGNGVFSFNAATYSGAYIGSSDLDIPAWLPGTVTSADVNRTVEIIVSKDDTNILNNVQAVIGDEYATSLGIVIDTGENIGIRWDDSGTMYDPEDMVAGQLTHYVFGFLANTSAIWKNGEMVNNYTELYDATGTAATDAWRIAFQGRNFGDTNYTQYRWANISVGIVRMYNRQLSNAEIMQNYITTKSRYS